MKTIEEEAKEAWADYCYRAGGSLYSTVFEDAYIQGATEALASQWVSVDEELPEVSADVLCLDGITNEFCVRYYDSEEWYTLDGKLIAPTAWMAIPPVKGGEA